MMKNSKVIEVLNEDETKEFSLVKRSSEDGPFDVIVDTITERYLNKRNAYCTFRENHPELFPTIEQLAPTIEFDGFSSGWNNVRYHNIKGSKSRLTLRGQPSPSSSSGVARVYLGGGKWQAEGSYINDGVVYASDAWRCQLEGSAENVKALYVYSISEGWLKASIDKNSFVLGHNTAQEDRHGWKEIYLRVPSDITDVYAL